MVINNRLRLQLILFLLFIIVSFATLSSSAIHVAAQEKVWNPGDRVEVQRKGDWYQAAVIEVKGNQYKIHYERYDSSWDEWVDSSRIRAAGIHNKPNPI